MENGDTGTVKKRMGRPKGSKNKKGLGHKNKGYTVSEKALAQRQQNSLNNRIIINTPEAIDYNTRLINHLLQINEIATHADKNDVNTLKSCFANYIKLCATNQFPVQNLAAYASMGFSGSRQFDLYVQKDDPEIREFGAMVKRTCSVFRESMVSEGKLNPVIGIFWQRNFDGLRNDTEQIQSVQAQEEEEFNGSKSYKDKYKKLIGE